MNRKFYWKNENEGHAVLYGPEEYEVAAVLTLDPGDPDLVDGRWLVMSSAYRALNFAEENTSISLEHMKRRILVFLGNEIEMQKKAMEEDMSNIISLIVSEVEM